VPHFAPTVVFVGERRRVATSADEHPLPGGFAVVLDWRVRRLDDATLLGGDPLRLARLAPPARELLVGDVLEVTDARSARLARWLLDAGLAHPRPRTASHAIDDVTIVVPVRDRATELDRLLTSLTGGSAVVVVDDGSADAVAIARVAEHHGAALVRHAGARGPAAARNTGLKAARTPLVAFLDSDCVAEPRWLEPLIAHFDDPLVALVGPRVVPLEGSGRGLLAAYESVRASHDLGAEAAAVGPGRAVAWLPSAALVARRAALGDGFDETLQAGEDVDLVWRLVEAGWRVRYEPRASVAHEHRVAWPSWAARKAFYGSAAGPLARSHGWRVAPASIPARAAAIACLLLARRRAAGTLAALLAGRQVYELARRLRPSPAADRMAIVLVARGLLASGRQLAALAFRPLWPISLLAALASRRARRLVIAAAIVEGLGDWLERHPPLDPFRYALVRFADNVAYGAGVWWGALRAGTPQPLLPLLRAASSSTRRPEAA
jgi:mycofactocin system glycosyltransferase